MQEQLIEAAVLLGVGMSVVFVFLTLLIGGIHCIAWVGRQFPDSVHSNNFDANKLKQAKIPQKEIPNPIPDSIVKAITAAIHTHRREKN